MNDTNVWLDNGEMKLSEKTLLQVITEGESARDVEREPKWIKVYDFPVWIHNAIVYIHRKHRNVPTVSKTTQAMTKLGVAILEDNDVIREAMRIQIERSGILSFENIVNNIRMNYELVTKWSKITIPYYHVSAYNWVDGAISEISSILRIAKYGVYLMTLIASLTTFDYNKDIQETAVTEYKSFLKQVREKFSDSKTD